MPISLTSMVVKVGADTKEALSGLAGVGDATKKMGGLFGATALTMTGGMGLIGGAVMGVAGFIGDMSKAAQEGEDRAAQLNAVLKSTGGAAGLTAQDLNKMALELMGVTKWDDEAWAASQTLMLSFQHIGKNIFPQAEMAAANLATRFGMDLTGATRMVGMALDNPAAALGRLTRFIGPVDEQTKNLIKTFMEQGNVVGAQNVVLDLLQKKLGGAAEAAGKTMSGSLVILQNEFANIKEAIGSAFLPIMAQVLQSITPVVIEIGQNLQPVMDRLGSMLSGIGGTVLPLVRQGFAFLGDVWKGLSPIIESVITPILNFKLQMDSVNPLMLIARTALSQLTDAFRSVQPILEGLIPQVIEIGRQIGGTVTQAVVGLLPTLINFATTMIKTLAPAIDAVIGALGNILPPLASLAASIGTTVVQALTTLLPMVLNLATTLLNTVSPAVGAVIGALQKLLPPILDAASGILQAALPALTSLVESLKPVFDWVGQVANQLADLLGPTVKDIGNLISAILPPVLKVVEIAMQALFGVVQTVWPLIQAIITTAINIIRGVLQTVTALIKGDWNGVWEGIKNIVSSIWEGIKSILSAAITAVWTLLKNALSTWWTVVNDGWIRIRDTIGSFMTAIWNGITGALSNIGKTLSDSWTSFRNGAASSWESIRKAVGDAIGNLFKDALTWGKSLLDGFTQGIRNAWNSFTNALGGIVNDIIKFVKSKLGIKSPSTVFMDIGKNMLLGMIRGFTGGDLAGNIGGFIQNSLGGIGNVIGSVVQKGLISITNFGSQAWKFISGLGGNLLGALGLTGGGAAPLGTVSDWLRAAIAITGKDLSWLSPLYSIAMHESGGNPRAINLWDINAILGHPSKGLMQTIDSTFNAYKLPGLNDIWNPIHNAVAAIRYISSRYGSVWNVPGIANMVAGRGYVGYAEGGWITEPVLGVGMRSGRGYTIGERGPEFVSPGGGNLTINVTSASQAEIAQDIVREQRWQKLLHG